MGQYQQWLLAQEIDRRLKAEVESLETELLYLKDRISILEQTVPETENIILQALLTHLRNQADQRPEGADGPLMQAETETRADAAQAEPIWSGLPRLDTPAIPVAASATYFPGPPPQTGRVADDMLAFFEERMPTDPRLAAWHPRENLAGVEISAEGHPVDEETRRLNESVQRWFERWRRQMADRSRTEEVQHEQ